MAGATTATQRESYASGRVAQAASKKLNKALSGFGKGDQLRGLCVVVALLLGGLGLVAPHLDSQLLTAALVLSGALALVLFAVLGLQAAPAAELLDLELAAAQPGRALQARASSSPRTIAELINRSNPKPVSDLDQWSHLTSRMSHELRTPLNAVLGFSEMMTSEVFGPLGSKHYADYARNIQQSGRVLLKSAEDALAITNLLAGTETRGHDTVCVLEQALDDALAFLEEDFRTAGIAVHSNCDSALAVLAEPQTLRQILINMLSDAREQSRRNSRISISCVDIGCEVAISITAEEMRDGRPNPDRFALVLARTLVVLCGTMFEEVTNEDGSWGLIAHIPLAGQRDLFTETTLH